MLIICCKEYAERAYGIMAIVNKLVLIRAEVLNFKVQFHWKKPGSGEVTDSRFGRVMCKMSSEHLWYQIRDYRRLLRSCQKDSKTNLRTFLLATDGVVWALIEIITVMYSNVSVMLKSVNLWWFLTKKHAGHLQMMLVNHLVILKISK